MIIKDKKDDPTGVFVDDGVIFFCSQEYALMMIYNVLD
jgi:hypothetical protein